MDHDATRLVHDAMPLTCLLGVVALSVTPEEVPARFDWAPERCTGAGVRHGAALMAPADACGARPGSSACPREPTGRPPSSRRPTSFGRCATGTSRPCPRLLPGGRTTIVIETDLFDAAGKRIARVTQTQAVLYPEG